MIKINGIEFLESDAGTLLYLGEDKYKTDYPRFIITSYTIGISSS